MMKNRQLKSTEGILACLLTVTAAALLVAVSTTSAQDVARPVKRAAAEVAVGGMTLEERLAWQKDLHAQLIAEMPEGALDDPTNVELTQQDRDDLAEPYMSGTPLRIGVVKTISPGVEVVNGKGFQRGVIQETKDGGFVWAMTVTSPEAKAIRVHFTNFSLPPNAEMFFCSPSGAADGPYVGVGRNGNGDFWTRSIASDTGVIQLRYKEADRVKISFAVSDLGHIHARPASREAEGAAAADTWPCADNAPCLIDANCTSGTPADPAKDAVAKMEWIIMPYIYTCTGGLLADTDPGTQIPYFLTANHCFDASISNLETWFNYTTDSCNGECPGSLVHGGTIPPSDTVGITVVATGTVGDYTLATLDEDPPAGATFLGWNNSPVAFSNGTPLYRISNANFGPQVYADYEVDTTTPICGGIPRGDWIYSTNIQGSTMGGSSGSPVLNRDSEVVGQLTGCCGYNCADDCDFVNNWTIDGAMASYWSAVEPFLAPPTLTLTGSCFYDPGMTQPVDPVTVEVTNLDTGTTFQASTAVNQYTLDLGIGTDVNAGDTLRYIAKDGTNFINVTDHLVTQGEIDARSIYLDLVLDEFYLDLTDFPMYEAEGPDYNEYTGPAIAQMTLNYMYWDADEDPTPPMTFDDQGALYTYGIDHNATPGLDYLDLVGMWHTIQDYRPLPYSQYGYNFSKRHDTDSSQIIKQIAQWIAYEIGTYGGHEEGHPLHVPGVIAAYGDYSNWMAVRGIHTSEDAYPLPPELDVYGFWVNDPFPASLGGIGENSYKTIAEFLATYYLPLTTGDAYDGEYVAICEPPETDGTEELFYVASPARFTVEAKEVIDAVRNQDSPPDELVEEANSWIVKAAVDGVSEQLIPYDDAFARRFARTVPGTPLFVTSSAGADYYAVPFDVAVAAVSSDLTSGGTAVVVLVDAEDGRFKEASWVKRPVAYLPVSKAEALEIAREVLEKLGIDPAYLEKAVVELVHLESTPYYPHWRITGKDFGLLIAQNGTVTVTK